MVSGTAHAAARPVSCLKTHSIFNKRSATGKAVYAAIKKKKAAAEANGHKAAPRPEISDANSFAESMTKGMILHENQGDLFGIYMAMYFGNPKTDLSGKSFASVMQILKENPNLEKSHFPEYEINKVVRVYESPQSLVRYIQDQIATAGQFRSNVFQIEANLGFWKKLLNFEDPPEPEALKKTPGKNATETEKIAFVKIRDEYREKKARSQKRFVAYLDRIISKPNRDLLKDEKVDASIKIATLFKTFEQLVKHLEKNKKDSRAIRQAMIDLVHSTGFHNPATIALLKSSDALLRLEGLTKINDERDTMSMSLESGAHFSKLLKNLDIEYSSITKAPEETTAKIISSFREETLRGKFSTKPIDTIRVRSLSIQEAGFRSCLGGSDCSTKTYFSKAFDPNYYYFTMTDKLHHSSGHLTVVLGEARDPNTGLFIKVAFADKLQNVPNQLIPEFLQAISLSLEKKGYKLAIPERLQLPEEALYHAGLSNTATIIQFVQDHILSKLSLRFEQFTPHAHQYQFENKYSRADKRLDVRIFEPNLKTADDTEIRPGHTYKTYSANANLNKEKLIANFLALRDSKNPEEMIQYITSLRTVEFLDQQKLFSASTFYQDLVRMMNQTELPLKVRKTAWLEYYQNVSDWKSIFLHLNSFTKSEKLNLAKEIHDWSESTTHSRKKFSEKFFSTVNSWLFVYAERGEFDSIRYAIGNKFINVNLKDENGQTLFQKAVALRNGELVRLLGGMSGINLNEKDTADLHVYKMHQKVNDARVSKNPEEILEYVNSLETVKMLEKYGLYSTRILLEDIGKIITQRELPLKVRKTAWLEYYQNVSDWKSIFQHFDNFSDSEKTALLKELRDWSSSTTASHRIFSEKFFSTMKVWSFQYAENGDLEMLHYIVKNKILNGTVASLKNASGDSLLDHAVRFGNKNEALYLAGLKDMKVRDELPELLLEEFRSKHGDNFAPLDTLFSIPNIKLNLPSEKATMLFAVAATLGNIPIMEQLVKDPNVNIHRGISYTNCKNCFPKTIRLAIEKGQLQAIEFIVNHTHPEHLESVLSQVLALSFRHKQQKITTYALNHPDIRFSADHLLAAMENGDRIAQEKILEKPPQGIHEDWYDGHYAGENILTISAHFPSPWLLKKLLEIPKIDINFGPRKNRQADDTVLHTYFHQLRISTDSTTKQALVECIEILLMDPRLKLTNQEDRWYSRDIESTKRDGYATALMQAIVSGNKKLISLVIEREFPTEKPTINQIHARVTSWVKQEWSTSGFYQTYGVPKEMQSAALRNLDLLPSILN